jgi:hypothetical protein
MKRIGILLFVFAIALTSCNKDDDNQDPLVGTWEMKEIDVNDVYTELLTFKSDQTGVIITTYKYSTDPEEIDSYIFSWTTSNNLLTIRMEGETFSFAYAISGNKLTLSESGDSIVYTRK